MSAPCSSREAHAGHDWKGDGAVTYWCAGVPLTAPTPPSPSPWRPEGEGWDTYPLSDVRGLDGWEMFALAGPFPTPTSGYGGFWSTFTDDTLVYARPIPEPPIKVGDRVRDVAPTAITGDRYLVLAIDTGEAWLRVLESMHYPQSVGRTAVRPHGDLRRTDDTSEPDGLTTHRCPS